MIQGNTDLVSDSAKLEDTICALDRLLSEFTHLQCERNDNYDDPVYATIDDNPTRTAMREAGGHATNEVLNSLNRLDEVISQFDVDAVPPDDHRRPVCALPPPAVEFLRSAETGPAVVLRSHSDAHSGRKRPTVPKRSPSTRLTQIEYRDSTMMSSREIQAGSLPPVSALCECRPQSSLPGAGDWQNSTTQSTPSPLPPPECVCAGYNKTSPASNVTAEATEDNCSKCFEQRGQTARDGEWSRSRNPSVTSPGTAYPIGTPVALPQVGCLLSQSIPSSPKMFPKNSSAAVVQQRPVSQAELNEARTRMSIASNHKQKAFIGSSKHTPTHAPSSRAELESSSTLCRSDGVAAQSRVSLPLPPTPRSNPIAGAATTTVQEPCDRTSAVRNVQSKLAPPIAPKPKKLHHVAETKSEIADNDAYSFAEPQISQCRTTGTKPSDPNTSAVLTNVDIHKIPGYKTIGASDPDWKKALLQKKNNDVVKTYLKNNATQNSGDQVVWKKQTNRQATKNAKTEHKPDASLFCSSDV